MQSAFLLPKTLLKGGEKMKIEIRSDDCAVISGYVNAVERRSRVISRPGAPPFREIVKPGTCKKQIPGLFILKASG